MLRRERKQPPEGCEQAGLDALGVVAEQPVGHEAERPVGRHADETVGERERALGGEPDGGLLRRDRTDLLRDRAARQLVAERERGHVLAVRELVQAGLVGVDRDPVARLELCRVPVVVPVRQDHRSRLAEPLGERIEPLVRRSGIQQHPAGDDHVRADMRADPLVVGLPVHDPRGDLTHATTPPAWARSSVRPLRATAPQTTSHGTTGTSVSRSMRPIREHGSEAAATLAPFESAPRKRVLAAIAVTVTAWASAFVAIRGVRDSFEPGALALGRLLVGSLALGGLLLARRSWVRPDRREWALIVLCGVAWFAIYNVALNAAEQRVDAGTAAMLINVGPILIALLAGLLLGEGFPRWLLIGAGVAFAGAVVIGAATAHTTSSEIAGVALCLAAALAWAIGVLAQKPALRRLPALQVTQMACTVGALACLPFAGTLIDEAPDATAGDVAGPDLPRSRPDRDRVLHLGLRALAHVGRQSRGDHVPRSSDHHRRRVADARGDATRARTRRRRAGADRRLALEETSLSTPPS